MTAIHTYYSSEKSHVRICIGEISLADSVVCYFRDYSERTLRTVEGNEKIEKPNRCILVSRQARRVRRRETKV